MQVEEDLKMKEKEERKKKMKGYDSDEQEGMQKIVPPDRNKDEGDPEADNSDPQSMIEAF